MDRKHMQWPYKEISQMYALKDPVIVQTVYTTDIYLSYKRSQTTPRAAALLHFLGSYCSLFCFDGIVTVCFSLSALNKKHFPAPTRSHLL